MKMIINGRKYDTETAKMVGYWSNNYSYSDFNYCEERLYKKKTGEYFLYGEGGAMSKYSVSCGQNTWGSGQTIIPMKESNAREWAEKHLSVDEYEKLFGEVKE